MPPRYVRPGVPVLNESDADLRVGQNVPGSARGEIWTRPPRTFSSGTPSPSPTTTNVPGSYRLTGQRIDKITFFDFDVRSLEDLLA
jgi:hypothetical protein